MPLKNEKKTRLMPKFLSRSLFILICLGYFLANPLEGYAVYQQDSIQHDFQDDWLIYNRQVDSYTPYISNLTQSKTSFSFILDREKSNGNYLSWCFQKGTTLFVEQQIVAFYDYSDCRKIDLDSLFSVYNNRAELFVTIYNKALNFSRYKTFLVSKNKVANENLNDGLPVIAARNDQMFKNFYLITLILFLGFLSTVYNLNPKNFKEYYSLAKTFSLRLRYENIVSLKIFNWSNLIILLSHCLLISYLLIVVLNLMGDPIPYLNIEVEGVLSGIWRWIVLAFIIFFLILAKYFLIKVLTTMMNLRELDNIHFFEFIRFSIFIYSVALLMVGVFLLAYYNPPVSHFNWVIYMAAFLSVVRIILLYLKFLRLSTFRNLYLFSYLCTTEILPLIIGFKIFVLNF